MTNCTSARCRAWAEVDLGALARNYHRVRSRLTTGCQVLAVVKANGYGHGAVTVARRLSEEGCWGFGVGDSQEALELREAGIDCPILILGAIIEGEMPCVVQKRISVCIHSTERVIRLEAEARNQGQRARVHLMVDTGMGRLGPGPDKALELARIIDASPWLELEGVCTHFSSAYQAEQDFSRVQADIFRQARLDLERAGIRPPLCHGPNSGAILSDAGAGFDLARPGIALYGLDPHDFFGRHLELEPVLSFRTSVVYLKDVPGGTPVGYNRTWVSSQPTRIATLPVGYNDGYPYRLSNLASVLVRGQRSRVVGTVSMDYTMIDVGHIPDVAPGDPVTLIGRDGDDEITVNELADLAGTIPYEITCGLGTRVRRIAVERREPGPLTRSDRPTPLRRLVFVDDDPEEVQVGGRVV